MTGRTHALIGANTIWLVKLFGLPFNPVLILVAAFAAILPDLDASESMVKHLEVKIGTGRNAIGLKPLYVPALLAHAIFKHRGWLHSLAAVVLVGALSWAFLRQYGVAFPVLITAGYLSHILADACTKSGVQMILPIPTEVRLLPKPLRFKTGGLIENLIFIIAALGLVAAFV